MGISISKQQVYGLSLKLTMKSHFYVQHLSLMRQWMLNMELSGRRKTQGPQRLLMDRVKQNIQKAAVTEEDVRDRVRLRHIICCGEQPKEEDGLL